MDPRGPAPQPAQKPEKHGRVRRRKTRRERNKALVGSHRSLSRQDPVMSSREQSVVLQDPMASKAPKLVVITQGRLSREHRGLFNHEVKSLDVTRLLNSGSLDPGSPVLPTRASHSPCRVQEPASQSRGKENQVMHGGSGPDPPSPPEPPVLGQLLGDFQSQLILPQAFPRRNLVQEARDAVVGTLQACHGGLPDLCLVLRAFQPPLPETKSRVQGRLRMAPSWVTSPEPVPGEGKQTPQETPELPFALMNTSSTSPAHRGGLVPPMGLRPPLLPSLPSPSGTTWGPPTAFDLLKSIWLIATPPPSQSWDVFPPQAPPQPLSPLLSRTAALDWSPSSPAPLPSLSWMVAQNSPEAWSFPPMRLY